MTPLRDKPEVQQSVMNQLKLSDAVRPEKGIDLPPDKTVMYSNEQHPCQHLEDDADELVSALRWKPGHVRDIGCVQLQ